ncbi:MAG: hypothetical protein ACI4UO_06650 [Paludibacteraceae bacterium]
MILQEVGFERGRLLGDFIGEWSVGYLLRAYTALPPWAMYVLLFLAMFTLTPTLYLLIRRIPILCYCVLGIKVSKTSNQVSK